ncbi:uncharacterized protein LOC105914406 [Setaria italica]|nr:uncharacterized protein LOC105914406 [Setaria italica]
MAAPPPPQALSMEELPEETQRLILRHIPCSVDHGRMSLVCRAWRNMIRRQRNQLVGQLLPQRRLLPWLLLRAPFPVGSTRVACVLSGCRVHHFLNITPPEARCFGSHDGAWLLLDTRELRPHKALNIRTGNVCDLPRKLRRRTDPYIHRMVIHVATLSSSPEHTNYVGAAIVTSWRNPAPGVVAALPPRRRCVALWRKNWRWVFDFVPPGDGDVALDVEDVLYLYSGAFAFVTQGEHLRLCKPFRLQENMLTTNWETLRFRPRGRLHDQYVRARYLVVSREELLMVVRFTPHPNQPTSKFKVFRGIERNIADADANFPVDMYPFEWSELDTLGDQMLFVGHGCSRSYKADEYLQGGIYFLDDGKFYDDAVIFGNGNVNHYPCSDNGMWSEGGHVQRCFPRPDPSDQSAPVWLLP